MLVVCIVCCMCAMHPVFVLYSFIILQQCDLRRFRGWAHSQKSHISIFKSLAFEVSLSGLLTLLICTRNSGVQLLANSSGVRVGGVSLGGMEPAGGKVKGED